jgi:anti-anti-sigma factor
MVKLTYQYDNNEKIAIISIDKESINNMDTMEFTNIINNIDKDTKQVIIDLENVMFISSPGISMILNAHISLKRNNILLKIINVSKNIQRLFVMTRIDSIISIEYKEKTGEI